jgi:hypothetical protein
MPRNPVLVVATERPSRSTHSRERLERLCARACNRWLNGGWLTWPVG